MGAPGTGMEMPFACPLLSLLVTAAYARKVRLRWAEAVVGVDRGQLDHAADPRDTSAARVVLSRVRRRRGTLGRVFRVRRRVRRHCLTVSPLSPDAQGAAVRVRLRGRGPRTGRAHRTVVTRSRTRVVVGKVMRVRVLVGRGQRGHRGRGVPRRRSAVRRNGACAVVATADLRVRRRVCVDCGGLGTSRARVTARDVAAGVQQARQRAG